MSAIAIHGLQLWRMFWPTLSLEVVSPSSIVTNAELVSVEVRVGEVLGTGEYPHHHSLIPNP